MMPKADGAQFQTAVPIPASILKAVLARLSVMFSAALRPKQPDQQPLLPSFAVRL